MKRILLLAAVALVALSSCNAPKDGYELVWADEFEQDGAPNPENWTYELMRKGQVNNEEQEYVNSLDNAWVEDGILHIKAIKDGDRITSARLISQGKQAWKYGRVEARIKVPAGLGIWPAFWMLPDKSQYGGWPRCGEIDIMEFVGYQPTTIHGTIHTGKYNHMIGTQKGTNTQVENCTEDYHIFTLDWTAENITISVDGNAYFSFDNDGAGDPGTWPFDQPFYIIMNVAFGGGWGGAEGVDYNILPAEMLVDWVRVYQKTE